MRELSLFTGIGGGVLGTMLLGWHPVGYVEWDDYCQRVLRQRIDDGYLPAAPIFGDIQTFTSDGYAAAYQGMVDVITAGFPCQPFSVAGKQLGADDPRNMWPATIEAIRLVRPRYALLENVPGLLSSGYFGTILGDLAESGYNAHWRILSAAEVGAPHKRDRLWIRADANSGQGDLRGRGLGDEPAAVCETISDAHGNGLEGIGRKRNASRPIGLCSGTGSDEKQSLSDTESKQDWRVQLSRFPADAGASGGVGGSGWWTTEPSLGRLADGVPNRVDRLRGIGNGQVPAVVATAWRLLTSEALR